jgi:hypothetical protein
VHLTGNGMLLGMHYPVTGSHQIQLSGPDRLLASEAVTVQQLAGKDPGNGLEPDMGMRSDPGSVAGNINRAGVIEKAPGAHSSPASLRQGAAHLHSAHVRRPAVHDLDISGRLTGNRHRISVEGCDGSAHGYDLLSGTWL